MAVLYKFIMFKDLLYNSRALLISIFNSFYLYHSSGIFSNNLIFPSCLRDLTPSKAFQKGSQSTSLLPSKIISIFATLKFGIGKYWR
jgi:hypothetical protein